MTISTAAERAFVCDQIQTLAAAGRARSLTWEEQSAFDRHAADLDAHDRAQAKAPKPADPRDATLSAMRARASGRSI